MLKITHPAANWKCDGVSPGEPCWLAANTYILLPMKPNLPHIHVCSLLQVGPWCVHHVDVVHLATWGAEVKGWKHFYSLPAERLLCKRKLQQLFLSPALLTRQERRKRRTPSSVTVKQNHHNINFCSNTSAASSANQLQMEAVFARRATAMEGGPKVV